MRNGNEFVIQKKETKKILIPLYEVLIRKSVLSWHHLHLFLPQGATQWFVQILPC